MCVFEFLHMDRTKILESKEDDLTASIPRATLIRSAGICQGQIRKSVLKKV